MLNIIHIDDSKFALKTTIHHLSQVFKDCRISPYTDEEFKMLMDKRVCFEGVDILVTDLMMPDISGHDILKYIKSLNVGIYLVILSSNVQHTEKELALKNGADYFVEKPSTVEKLKKMGEAFYASRGV